MSQAVMKLKRYLISLLAVFLLAMVSQAAPEEEENPGVPLEILNREIAVFRVPLENYSPEQRAKAAKEVITRIASSDTQPPELVVNMHKGDAQIMAGDQIILTIKEGDIFSIGGESMDSTVNQAVENIQLVIDELYELKDHRMLVGSIIKTAAATLLLICVIWIMSRNRQRLEARLLKFSAQKASHIKSRTLRLVGLQNTGTLLRGLMTTVFWVTVFVGTFLWIEYAFLQFPYTRAFGEQLIGGLIDQLLELTKSFISTLPDLGIVFIFWLIARFASSVNRRFFRTIARTGRYAMFDTATAQVTQRLLTILIWVIALILAFPYIPGSHSPAFRGISVLAGLMISLGSGNLISQMINGLIIIYSNIGRVGDHIRIDTHEGVLMNIGLTTSRIRTLKKEEIHVPNAYLTSKALTNYSQIEQEEGVVCPVKVSIGYGVPWRKVHAMLKAAAAQTEGLRKDVEPTVFQVELADFYVVYQLNVHLQDSLQRKASISRLNANIQDIFNANGIQIMSPHYRDDPPQPVVVPKEKWKETLVDSTGTDSQAGDEKGSG